MNERKQGSVELVPLPWRYRACSENVIVDSMGESVGRDNMLTCFQRSRRSECTVGGQGSLNSICMVTMLGGLRIAQKAQRLEAHVVEVWNPAACMLWMNLNCTSLRPGQIVLECEPLEAR